MAPVGKGCACVCASVCVCVWGREGFVASRLLSLPQASTAMRQVLLALVYLWHFSFIEFKAHVPVTKTHTTPHVVGTFADTLSTGDLRACCACLGSSYGHCHTLDSD